MLEYCDINELDEREIYYIAFYETFLDKEKGYNLTSGGQANKKYSEEVCEKIRNSLIGHEVSIETRIKISQHHADVSGEKHPMYGKHHSEAAKEKVRQAQLGRISPKRNRNKVYCVELAQTFDDATEAGKKLNIDSSAILKCCKGERKTCGGYHWKFIDLEK